MVGSIAAGGVVFRQFHFKRGHPGFQLRDISIISAMTSHKLTLEGRSRWESGRDRHMMPERLDSSYKSVTEKRRVGQVYISLYALCIGHKLWHLVEVLEIVSATWPWDLGACW